MGSPMNRAENSELMNRQDPRLNAFSLVLQVSRQQLKDWLRLHLLLASGVQQMVTLTVVGYLCQDLFTVDGLELVCTTPGSL